MASEDSDVDVFSLFARRLTWDEKGKIAGTASDIDMANGTWTGWLAETVEQWADRPVAGEGFVRAVEDEGVAVWVRTQAGRRGHGWSGRGGRWLWAAELPDDTLSAEEVRGKGG